MNSLRVQDYAMMAIARARPAPGTDPMPVWVTLLLDIPVMS